MCGITGWVGPIEADPGPTVEAMVASISHRGPDDRHTWTGDEAALGTARLAIIDPDGGQQPKFAGPWCVVVNGEIYNYRELRAELAADGVSFGSGGDTEVVAHAVNRWGSAAFDRLDGMYAIAAFNRESRDLLLARDRFGEKPLYLWRRDATVVFASEPRAFRPVGPMPDIDTDSVIRYLALGFVPGPQSIWEAITTLPPGHHAVVSGGQVTIAPIDGRGPYGGGGPGTEEDLLEGLDRRLATAVASRLVADVDVGVLLSGGIDSSLVAAHAAALHPGIHSFSVAIDDPRRDESPFARSVAATLATTHHEITVGDADALGVLEDLVDVYDEPFADSSAIPTVLLSRFVADHVKVALSGDGGDELFSGYRRHGLVGGEGRRRVSGVVDHVAATATHTWWVRPQDPWRKLRDRHADPVTAYLDEMGALGPTGLRRLHVERSPLRPIRERAERARARDAARWAEAVDRDLYLPGDILVKIDRASMSCGLEVRAPFLAPEVADWAAALSRTQTGAPGAKELPRALARRYFGTEISDRPKQGFSVPLPAWLRGGLGELVDLACDGHLTSSGLLDRRAVLGLKRALHRRFDAAAHPLWTIAMFELWFQRW